MTQRVLPFFLLVSFSMVIPCARIGAGDSMEYRESVAEMEQLVRELGSRNPVVRSKAMSRLINLDFPLPSDAPHGVSEERIPFGERSRRIEEKRKLLAPSLWALLKDPSFDTRIAAIIVIVEGKCFDIGPDRDIEESMKSENLEVRMCATCVRARTDSATDPIPVIAEALDRQDRGFDLLAAIMIWTIAPKANALLPRLLPLVRAESGESGIVIARAFEEAGQESIALVDDIFEIQAEHGEFRIRYFMREALGSIAASGGREQVLRHPSIVRLLGSKYEDARVFAAEVILTRGANPGELTRIREIVREGTRSSIDLVRTKSEDLLSRMRSRGLAGFEASDPIESGEVLDAVTSVKDLLSRAERTRDEASAVELREQARRLAASRLDALGKRKPEDMLVTRSLFVLAREAGRLQEASRLYLQYLRSEKGGSLAGEASDDKEHALRVARDIEDYMKLAPDLSSFNAGVAEAVRIFPGGEVLQVHDPMTRWASHLFLTRGPDPDLDVFRSRCAALLEEPRREEFLHVVSMLGNPSPEIRVDHVIGGEPTEPSDLEGNVTILYFFLHSHRPCKRGFPILRELSAKHGRSGLSIVGMTYFSGKFFDPEMKIDDNKLFFGEPLEPEDELRYLAAFREHYQCTWPFWIEGRSFTYRPEGPGGKEVTIEELGNFSGFEVTGLPKIVVLDRTGAIRFVLTSNEYLTDLRDVIPRLL